MIKDIRPFFRAQLVALGYKEWRDGFNFENIPANVLNGSFHIATPSGGRRGDYSQALQEIEQDVEVRIFFKGFRDPASAIDLAMDRYQTLLETVLSRGRGCSIKNIYLNTMQILPLNQTNDNSVILEVTFSCLIMIDTGGP
jgi:hypothetical protein